MRLELGTCFLKLQQRTRDERVDPVGVSVELFVLFLGGAGGGGGDLEMGAWHRA